MKITVYSTVIYFLLAFIYKLLGEPENDYWVNFYWTFSSIYFFIITLQISIHLFVRKYKLIMLFASIYWAIMSLFYIICFFKITLYDSFVRSASKLTIGAVSLFVIIIFLTYKAFKYDSQHEG
jgi:cytochrome bd-type quinol oxidase subunit 2